MLRALTSSEVKAAAWLVVKAATWSEVNPATVVVEKLCTAFVVIAFTFEAVKAVSCALDSPTTWFEVKARA